LLILKIINFNHGMPFALKLGENMK